MAQIICKQCGAENDSEDRFCGKCDVYLPWDDGTVVKTPEQQDDAPVSAPDHSRGAPPPRSDGAARPPQITPSTTTATLDGDTGAQIDIEVCNRSTIVDAFRVDIITPPQWLTLSPREVRVFPNESALLPAIFRIQSGAQVIAQTVDVVIRISSLRDTDQYVDARVSLTVPPAGPPVSISVQPAMVRLVDQTEGQAHLLLDNTDSNYPRTVALTGTDDQGALEFHFSPPRLEIGPGRTGQVEVRLRAPEIPEGANETRTATITATEGKNTTQARLTVNQQRSTMLPLRLRLEPSVRR